MWWADIHPLIHCCILLWSLKCIISSSPVEIKLSYIWGSMGLGHGVWGGQGLCLDGEVTKGWAYKHPCWTQGPSDSPQLTLQSCRPQGHTLGFPTAKPVSIDGRLLPAPLPSLERFIDICPGEIRRFFWLNAPIFVYSLFSCTANSKQFRVVVMDYFASQLLRVKSRVLRLHLAKGSHLAQSNMVPRCSLCCHSSLHSVRLFQNQL